MKKHSLHPACKILPPLAQEELLELAEDIGENGLRNPIVLLDGKILDGRNRYEACRIAKVKPRFTKFQGDDPIGWVVSQNIVRRHLTPSQRAVVAFDILPLLEKEARERQRKGTLAPQGAKGKSSEKAAKIAKSSARSIERVKAISKKSPELLDEIRSGKVTVAVAERLASNHRTKPKKRIPRDSRVIKGECLKLIPTLEDGSVNLVLTSPPYAEQRKRHYKGVSEEDYPDWTVDWMGHIWDKLADDGSVSWGSSPCSPVRHKAFHSNELWRAFLHPDPAEAGPVLPQRYRKKGKAPHLFQDLGVAGWVAVIDAVVGRFDDSIGAVESVVQRNGDARSVNP